MGTKAPVSATWDCPKPLCLLPGSLPQWNAPLPIWCTYRNGHLHKSIPQPNCFVINFRESFLASWFYSHLPWAMTPFWVITLLSYCYIKEYSILSQAESYWLHSSALIRYVIRSYFLELSIDQRYDQWQPLNISKSIHPEILFIQKSLKVSYNWRFRFYSPPLFSLHFLSSKVC